MRTVLCADWLLFWLLAAACGVQLYWGLRKRERHWQFPTVAAACWIFYMLPMAFGALRNPSKFPLGVLEDRGLALSLAMCLLCVLATWFGWRQGLRIPPAPRLTAESSSGRSSSHTAKLFYYGLFVFLVGFWGAWKISVIMGGFRAQFTEGANYETEWAGAPVKYFFFALLIYPGFLFSFRAWLERSDHFRAVILALMALYPLAVAAFLGRRGASAVFLIVVAVCIFFRYRWSLHPLAMASVCALAGLIVLLAPAYRAVASSTGNVRRGVEGLNVKDAMSETLSGYSYAEYDALVVGCAFYNRELRFDFGTSLYNGLIGCLVPRQIVGEAMKAKLLLELHPEGTTSPDRVYGWALPYGCNPTGPLDAFKSFWFFGCLMYFVLAWWLARLWREALAGSIFHQLAYVLLIPSALATVYGCWTILPEALLRTGAVLLPVYFIYQPRPRQILHRHSRTSGDFHRLGRKDTTASNFSVGQDRIR